MDLIKSIGFQIAAILKLFSMNGLSLIHGSLRSSNIFFKRSGVPEFKLIDFSSAFFLDEQPASVQDINTQYRAPELGQMMNARSFEQKAQISLQKVDLWALGCLLFELHFRRPLDTTDVQGSLRQALQEHGLPQANYYLFNSLVSGLV